MDNSFETFKNFMIEQQVQFWADLRAIDEKHAEITRIVEANSRQIETNREMIRQLVDVSMSLARHSEDTERFLKELGAETDRRLKDHMESQAHSDRRLDALVDMVQETDRSLKESKAETDRYLKELGAETDRRMKELREFQAQSDRRLDALIKLVDQLAWRNGGSHDKIQ